MGRREEPIDPATGPLAAFAADLRRLREAAGSPSYRQLARTAHYSASALSSACSGKSMPSWNVTRALVQACGGDVGQWQPRWQQVVAELQRELEAEPGDQQAQAGHAVIEESTSASSSEHGQDSVPGISSPDGQRRTQPARWPRGRAAAVAVMATLAMTVLFVLVRAGGYAGTAQPAAASSSAPQAVTTTPSGSRDGRPLLRPPSSQATTRCRA